MTVYGIDPAADTFTVAAYPASPPATFDNTPEGITAFRATLPDGDHLVAVENTGVYSELLCYGLFEAGVPLVLVAPGAIHRLFPGTPKTDPADAAKVAEYAARFDDQLARWEPHAEVVEQVRVLLTTREQLVGQRTAALNARGSLRRKVVQTPGANAALDAVAAHLRTQVEALEAELKRLVGAHPTLAQGVSLLDGIPGVGFLLGAQMLVLTSGFTECPSYRPLAQRLGIAPNDFRSGRTVRRRAHSRGYGQPVVRKLLRLAAWSVCRNKPQYRRYFAAKRAEGKEKSLVFNNVANRLLRVMCAVLRDGVPYQPGHISVSPMLLTSHRQSG